MSAMPAIAASGVATAVIADCNAHGRLTRTYSSAELQAALASMPADVKEYTNCYDVIQRALLGRLGRSHAAPPVSSGGSGGAFLPTPVIVGLVVLALAGGGFGVMAIRRR
jgi:hypothetical protein